MTELESLSNLKNELDKTATLYDGNCENQSLELLLSGTRTSNLTMAFGEYLNELDHLLKGFTNEYLKNHILSDDRFQTVHSINTTRSNLKIRYEIIRREGDDGSRLKENIINIRRGYAEDIDLLDPDLKKIIVNKVKEKDPDAETIKITQTHNILEYVDKDLNAEFRIESRLKKDILHKIVEYVCDKEPFPTDLAGTRLIPTKPAYIPLVYDLLDRFSIIDRSFRNVPQSFNLEEIWRANESASDLASLFPNEQGINPSKEERAKLLVGVWVDFYYESAPMEIQLLTRTSHSIMTHHTDINHFIYKSREKRYTGREKLIERFINRALEPILEDLRFEKI